MRDAAEILRNKLPDIEIDGEMHADAALSQDIRDTIMPGSNLTGAANLLVMPTVDAANITYNALKMMTDSTVIGPVLLGMNKPAHICTTAVTPRGLVNMTALAVAHAVANEAEG
jgi:malate dehydrogenase (oxaloacetate-decarboxylating)(NADP+)